MRTVDISQAKMHLSRLVEEAAGGWEGKVWMADDFDSPLPKELEDAFYGGDGGDPTAA